MSNQPQCGKEIKELSEGIGNKSQIEIEMDTLDRYSSQLIKSIVELEDRLSKILRISYPSKDKEPSKEEITQVPLALDLFKIGDGISLSISQIDSMIDRIEL